MYIVWEFLRYMYRKDLLESHMSHQILGKIRVNNMQFVNFSRVLVFRGDWGNENSLKKSFVASF